MTWGVELSDTFGDASAHTARGLESLERYSKFQRERADVENRYVADIRGLIRKYASKKKHGESICGGGGGGGADPAEWAFQRLLQYVGQLADQHETLAQQLAASLSGDVGSCLRQLHTDRKQLQQENSRLNGALQSQRQLLDKSRRNHRKAARDAEKARQSYQKAEADMNLSRLEIEKQRRLAADREQQCERCRAEYDEQLHTTDQLQRQHCERALPALLASLRRLDERRVLCFQQHLQRAVGWERQLLPALAAQLDVVGTAVSSVSPQQCARAAEQPRADDRAASASISLSSSEPLQGADDRAASASISLSGSEPLRGARDRAASASISLSGSRRSLPTSIYRRSNSVGRSARLRKRGGILGLLGLGKLVDDTSEYCTAEDWTSLPLAQRKRRIQSKLDELAVQLTRETATRDGLVRLRAAYEGDRTLGDPGTVDSQLQLSADRLDAVQAELRRYQSLLDSGCGHRGSLSGSGAAVDSTVSRPGQPRARGRSAPPAPATPSLVASRPESGLGTSRDSGSESEPTELHWRPADAALALPILIDACAEDTLPLREGEQVLVVEWSTADGRWTRVRRLRRAGAGDGDGPDSDPTAAAFSAGLRPPAENAAVDRDEFFDAEERHCAAEEVTSHGKRHCAAEERHCPAEERHCPAEERHCPAEEVTSHGKRHCATEERHCPAEERHCPAEERHCPAEVTSPGEDNADANRLLGVETACMEADEGFVPTAYLQIMEP